jgi:hypothetical protein
MDDQVPWIRPKIIRDAILPTAVLVGLSLEWVPTYPLRLLKRGSTFRADSYIVFGSRIFF